MKTIIQVFVIALVATLTSGCAGMIMDAIVQSERSSDKTFSELTKTRETIPTGKGRVFLYRTEASTISSLRYGIGLQKNIVYCSLDGKLIAMYWELYLFLDVSPGEHNITCVKGKEIHNTLLFSVNSKNNHYIRVDAALEKNKKTENSFDEEDDEHDINEFIGDKTSAYIH